MGTGVLDAYGTPQSLLVRGLLRSQERTTTRQDPRRTRTQQAAVAAGRSTRAGPAEMPALWRWAPEFRARAATAELASHVLVEPDPDDSGLVWLYRCESLANPGGGRQFMTSLGFPTPRMDWTAQSDKVLRAAIERDDRLPEIVTQCEDVWSYFHVAAGLVPGTAPRLAEVMDIAWAWAEGSLMAIKHHLAVLRPFQRNRLIVPIIQTPGHGSLPSGHATMAAMTSQLLIDLLGIDRGSERALTLDRLARRIAFNRVVAGVHFPIDSLAGYLLGKHLAALLRAWAGDAMLPVRQELQFVDDAELDDRADPSAAPEERGSRLALPIWRDLWAAATCEMVGRGAP